MPLLDEGVYHQRMISKANFLIAGVSAVLLLAAAAAFLRMGRDGGAVSSGRATIPHVQQFERLFPGSLHSISYSTGEYGPPTWNSKAALHGRYVLTMQMPLEISRERRSRIVSHGKPTFYLMEIKSVANTPDGRVEVLSGPTHATFGPAEWDKIVRSGGDLSVLGLEIRKGEPVPGFEQHWERE